MTTTDYLLIVLIVLEAMNIAQAHFLHDRQDRVANLNYELMDEMLKKLLETVRGKHD